jgi:hypothetical protein
VNKESARPVSEGAGTDCWLDSMVELCMIGISISDYVWALYGRLTWFANGRWTGITRRQFRSRLPIVAFPTF